MCSCGREVKDPKYEALEVLLAKYKDTSGKLIPVLQQAQDIFGYLPGAAIERISASLDIPSSKIYGVATFYGQFYLQPRGKNIIRVCTGTACHVRGAGKVMEAIKKSLSLKEDSLTTDDLLFTIEPVACIGACGMAPVIMINEDTYGRLTPREVPDIIERYKEGEKECVA